MRVKDQLGFFYEIDTDAETLWMLDLHKKKRKKKEEKPVLSFQELTSYSWQRLEEGISDEYWEWLPEQERWAGAHYEPRSAGGASGSIFHPLVGGASA